MALIGLPGILSAAGLTLYSYRDGLGQTIIVDSLEKIPAQYRKQARQEFIPSFRSPKPAKNNLTIIEAVPDDDQGSPASGNLPRQSGISPSTPEIIAPPDEDYSAELASATAIMESLRAIQLDSERMYVIANSFGVESPLLMQLHQKNLLAVSKLESLRRFNWDPGKTWKEEALEMLQRYRTMINTISAWLRHNRQGLKVGLMPLLQANSLHLKNLEKTFTTLK